MAERAAEKDVADELTEVPKQGEPYCSYVSSGDCAQSLPEQGTPYPNVQIPHLCP